MKKLDKLILKSFIGPFILTFLVVLFILLMQFFWLYMDDLIGKGLPILTIMELMSYMSATLVPMAMPLGILLASIMTFGNLGENFELVAIKSSGISLFRFMRPLTIFILFIVSGMILFSNYVIPKANLKAFSLLYDIQKQKPIMSIKPGMFNKGIGNFVIRVGSKSEDGETIHDVMIYDHTRSKSNTSLITAKDGKLFLSNNKRFLIFELNDGWRYQIKKDDSGSYEQQRMYFKHWSKVVDVSSFGFKRTEEDLFKSNEEMMSLELLNDNVDSIKKMQVLSLKEMKRSTGLFLTFLKSDSNYLHLAERINSQETLLPKQNYTGYLINSFPDSIKETISEKTLNNLQSMQRYVDIYKTNIDINKKRINDFDMEWHKKFTLGFACLVFFLLGAPMGAIVRKGGLGMPTVLAVSFFVVYFVISTAGEKLAKESKLSPMAGMWLATVSLLPIAIFVLYKARNDSPILKKESYTRFISNFKKMKKLNKLRNDESRK
ncbi:MAG TPA: LptF/LptG family permease [Edaphocola sp.]|nr:LptF/LptG family permease [Edaphocola sp.]